MKLLAALIKSKLDADYPDISEIAHIDCRPGKIEINMPGNTVRIKKIGQSYWVKGKALTSGRVCYITYSKEEAAEKSPDVMCCKEIVRPYKLYMFEILMNMYNLFLVIVFLRLMMVEHEMNGPACFIVFLSVLVCPYMVCIGTRHIRLPMQTIEMYKYVKKAKLPIPIRNEILAQL